MLLVAVTVSGVLPLRDAYIDVAFLQRNSRRRSLMI